VPGHYPRHDLLFTTAQRVVTAAELEQVRFSIEYDAAPVDGVPNGGEQRIIGERLHQKPHRPRLERPNGHRDIAAGGDGNDGRLLALRGDAP